MVIDGPVRYYASQVLDDENRLEEDSLRRMGNGLDETIPHSFVREPCKSVVSVFPHIKPCEVV